MDGSTLSFAPSEGDVPLFLRKDWARIAKGDSSLAELLAHRHGVTVGRLQYIVKPGLLGIKIAGSPYWSPYGGITLSSALSDLEKYDVARELIMQLPRNLSVEFQFPSHTPDAHIIRRAYVDSGFSISGNRTRILRPEQPGIFIPNAIDELGLQAKQSKLGRAAEKLGDPDLTSGDLVSGGRQTETMNAETGQSLNKTRAQIRKASRELEVVSMTADEFVKAYEENLQGVGVTSKEPLPILRDLIKCFSLTGDVRVFAARKKAEAGQDPGTTIDAAIACAYDNERCYVWRMTVRKHSSVSGSKPHPHAAKLVLIHAMRDARSRGLVFDTEGGAQGQTEVLYPRLRISELEERLVAARLKPVYFLVNYAKNVAKEILLRKKI